MSWSSVLVYYDVNKPINYTLYCDFFPHGVGACLMHIVDGVKWPVAYALRTLSVAEQNYTQIEWEALGIIHRIWGKMVQS